MVGMGISLSEPDQWNTMESPEKKTHTYQSPNLYKCTAPKFLRQYFTKEEVRVASKQMKSCSTPLVNMEIHIRTLRFHYKLINMVKVQGENLRVLHVGEDVEKLECSQSAGKSVVWYNRFGKLPTRYAEEGRERSGWWWHWDQLWLLLSSDSWEPRD